MLKTDFNLKEEWEAYQASQKFLQLAEALDAKREKLVNSMDGWTEDGRTAAEVANYHHRTAIWETLTPEAVTVHGNIWEVGNLMLIFHNVLDPSWECSAEVETIYFDLDRALRENPPEGYR